MKCTNMTHARGWEIIDRRPTARRIYCDQCAEDWWTDEDTEDEDEDTDTGEDLLDPPPRPFRENAPAYTTATETHPSTEPSQTPPPRPVYRPRACSQQFIDLYTDGAGNCFSDADPGL